MARLTGTVHNIWTDSEGSHVVLRLVVDARGGERYSVEMRGRQQRGVVQTGDAVELRTKGRLRGRDGVIRPYEIVNLTTDSRLRMQSPGCVVRLARGVVNLAWALASGVLTAYITALLTVEESGPEIIPFMQSEDGGTSTTSTSEPDLMIPILVGVAVMLLVFFVLNIRSRRA